MRKIKSLGREVQSQMLDEGNDRHQETPSRLQTDK